MCAAAVKRAIAGIGQAGYLRSGTRSLISSPRRRRLIAEGYADRQAVFAQGGSAGGLVMGVMANLRPGALCRARGGSAFVDVVTTMSDPSVPLTTLEYEEWGNPADKREYDYMLSYSPYDNVSQKELSRNLR